MYVKRETEYQYHPFIINEWSDVVGGGTIARSDLKTTDELAPGAIVGEDSNGVYHVFKTAKVHANVAVDAVAIPVDKKHEFKAGDFVVDAKLALKAYAIDSIDTSNADYDVLTVGTAIGALTAGDIIVAAAAEEANAGDATYKYQPKAITKSAVDLTVPNQQAGLLDGGKVRENLLAYYYDATIKALLPHVIFD